MGVYVSKRTPGLCINDLLLLALGHAQSEAASAPAIHHCERTTG